MKKIMFNDRFCLTQAVLDGTKTMTRRIEKPTEMLFNIPKRRLNRMDDIAEIVKGFDDNGKWYFNFLKGNGNESIGFLYPRYQVGEVVAIAQSYEDAHVVGDTTLDYPFIFDDGDAGYCNKMFVKAALMPHHIKITDVWMEKLQAISDNDCLREGIKKSSLGYYINGLKVKDWRKEAHRETENGCMKLFPTPRETYAVLIDKISGKGTWLRNPWMVVYEFQKVD